MTDELTDDFRERASLAIDGAATPEQERQLLEELKTSEAKRRYYLRTTHLSAMLLEHEGENEQVDAERPTLDRKRSIGKRIALALPIAAGLAIAALLYGVLMTPSAPPAIESPTTSGYALAIAPAVSGDFTIACIEISGSMIGEGRDFASVVSKTFEELAALSPNERFSVVAFASDRHAFQPYPIAATRTNLDQAKAWILGLRPDQPGAPEWPGDNWKTFLGGRHFGADILSTMEYCFDQSPDRIIYATDWVMDPGSPRVSKQRLIETMRKRQALRKSPAIFDAIVYQRDGRNRFLAQLATDNGGQLFETAIR